MKTLYQPHFDSIDGLAQRLAAVDYIASREIATSVYLGFNLEKPILVEGPAGVGKTELAKGMAEILDVPLIRMQCYEGLDESKALYEWKYGKQLLYTQLLKDKLGEMMQGAVGLAASIERLHAHDDLFFSEHFLEPRPLYQALHQERGCVLLVDEVDKSDPEFEAFLLEVLSDFQVSVPELGTIKAKVKPILERRVPGLSETLNRELVAFIQAVRQMDLKKQPSVSETIDWAKTLLLLHAEHLSLDMVKGTLNVFLKFEQDIASASEQLPALLQQARKDAEIPRASHA
jgi:MoxR-like ATPase